MFKIKSQGFTLIELLIVVALLGVLMVVLIQALKPLEILNKGRVGGATSFVSKACAAISACNSASTTNVCASPASEITTTNAPSYLAIPKANTVIAATGFTATLSRLGGAAACDITCVTNTGKVDASGCGL